MPTRSEIAEQLSKKFGLKEGSTPGPWEHDDGEITHECGVIAQVMGADDFPCCEEDIEAECQANAALIAAAPALRDALIEAEVRNEELNLELQKRDQCAFMGPMRDCPTHGESVRIKELESERQRLRDALRRVLVHFCGPADEVCVECGKKVQVDSPCDTCYIVGEAQAVLGASPDLG